VKRLSSAEVLFNGSFFSVTHSVRYSLKRYEL